MKGFIWVIAGLLSLGLAAGTGMAAMEEQSSPAMGEEYSSQAGTQEEAAAPAEKSKNSLEVRGTIESVNDKNNLLKVQKLEEPGEKGAAKAMEFAVNEKTSIMKGEREISLEDLEIGSQVTVTYKKPFLGFLGKKTALIIECE